MNPNQHNKMKNATNLSDFISADYSFLCANIFVFTVDSCF